jgi:hypothetical protein
MRRILLLGLLMALSAPALAELAPPVQVRLASGFAAARTGEDLTGTLEITCLESGQLSGLTLTGTGWTVARLSDAADRAVTKDDVVMVSFTARPTDPAERIVFECRIDDRPFRFGMDFSPENVKRMTEPMPTVEVPGGRGVVTPPLDLDKTGRGLIEGLSAPKAQDRRTITVHGRFVYIRSDGVTMPAHSILVKVYDDDGASGDDYLGGVYTDWNGYYSINVNSDDSGELEPDIYCLYELSNGRVVIVEETSGNRYIWGSSIVYNVAGSDVDFGTLMPGDEALHPAVHVHTNVSRTWVFDSNEGYDLPLITCNWPSANWTSYWAHVMYVNAQHQWQEGVMAHEYGHFFDDEFSGIEPFNYCNGICDSPPDCGHCFWCEESSVIAWMEGWANYHGYSFTAWYPGYYGIGPVGPLTVESLGDCGGSYDPPNITEGHCAALLQDIEDSNQDSHGVYGSWTDALALGRNEVFAVCDLDNPNAPSDFLAKFRARYAGYTYGLWETGANCGYDYDSTAPGAVTNLTSPSHPISTPSPDPTITYTWTAATDDYSGIAGYGISITTAGPALPSAVQDFGAVTTYTTASLAPGTYYFNIRAVDRGGMWSASYRSYGPVIIRSPEPADLTWRQLATWDYPLVPRGTSDATPAEARVSTTLPGNATSTYWNLEGLNQGEVTTSSGFYGWLNVDGVYKSGAYWGPIPSGYGYYATNWGPVLVPGGRHSFTCRHDATDLVFEDDETNNLWGRQFIWTPYTMTVSSLLTRAAPPLADGGWDDVTSGSIWYNCDGLRINASAAGWWNAAVIWAVNPAEDYDCRQHTATLGAEDGFGASNSSSYRGAGLIDAVVVNRNNVAGNWDTGVLNLDGEVGQYRAYHATSSIIAFGDSLTLALAANQPMLLREFYVAAAQVGPVSIVVDIDPANGPVAVQWLPHTYNYGSLTSGYGAQTTSNASGRARLDLTIAEAGWNGIMVYREPGTGMPAMNITVEAGTTPPDLTYWHRAGWHSPFVPRPATDGTPTSVPLPDTLLCAPGTTYLNLAVQNVGPVASPIPNRMYRDNVYAGYLSWPSLPAGSQVSYNWTAGFAWPAGRHVLSLRNDALQEIEEILETNNVWGEPWIWGPLSLSLGSWATRSAPPGMTAAWDDVTSGEGLWFNCDGIRLPQQAGVWWMALATMPAATADVDVRLHEVANGTKSGFGSNLASSNWLSGRSDYVLVNLNVTTRRAFDVGVLNPGGTTNAYTAQAAGSIILSGSAGTFGPYTLAANQIIALYEMYLPVGGYRLRLDAQSGTADLGLSLHPANDPYQRKSDVIATSWTAVGGTDEEVTFDVSLAGWYGIAVWKVASADLPLTGTYRLVMDSPSTPVTDDMPLVTRIAGAQPNPFNPQTTIAFDLARSGPADLAVFDIQGRRVRQLVSADLAAGRHTAVWYGRDDADRQVASGVYFVRLASDGMTEMGKLVLVK